MRNFLTRAGAWWVRRCGHRKATRRGSIAVGRALAGPAVPTAWTEVPGLTARQAEDLLDWLEANGITERTLVLRCPPGFAVRFR